MVQIDELLGNRKLMKLLGFLIDNSPAEFSYTEIRKKTKLAKATLTKWLGYLLKEKLIFVRCIGLNKLYRLNKCYFLIKQLKILNSLTKLAFLVNLSEKHQIEAYLFGSAARGEDTKQSDIDILIIGKIQKEEIIEEINKNSKKIGRKISLQVFTKLDWSRMMEKDSAFYERVEKDKILIK